MASASFTSRSEPAGMVVHDANHPTRSVSASCISESVVSAAELLPDSLDPSADDGFRAGALPRSQSLCKLSARAAEYVPKGVGVLGSALTYHSPLPNPPVVQQQPPHVQPLPTTAPPLLHHVPLPGLLTPLNQATTYPLLPILPSPLVAGTQDVRQLPHVNTWASAQATAIHTPRPHVPEKTNSHSLEASSHLDPKPRKAQGKGSVLQDSPDLVEVKAKMMKQVEFYFSDQNLPTDNYLMKFVKKEPEGFVPIGVLAGFRKVKALAPKGSTANSIVTLLTNALRSSSQLVLSEDGKKVRRLEPLGEIDMSEIQGRIVVVENLPMEHSIAVLEEIFGKVGAVKMVRVCNPEAANGATMSANQHPRSDLRISNKLHALVEYETQEGADRAVRELTDERNWRSGLRVRLLQRRMTKQPYQHAPVAKAIKKSAVPHQDGESEGEAGEKVPGDHLPAPRNIASPVGTSQGVTSDGEEVIVGTPGGNSDSENGSKRSSRPRGVRSKVRGKVGGVNNPGPGHHYSSAGTPPRSSPLSGSPLGSYLEAYMKPPPGPRMPDGTRGFALGRGKKLPAAIPPGQGGLA